MSIWDRDPAAELAAIRKRIRSGYHGTGGKGLAKRDLWYAMNLIDRGLVPVRSDGDITPDEASSSVVSGGGAE